MNPVSVDSVLDAVTVYAEGAICRRRAKVSVRQGEAWQLRLPGLPLSLVEGTLRASVVSGPAELRVRDVRPGFDVLLPEEADLPEEGKALERAEDQVRKLELERSRVSREITDLAALKPVLPEREKGGPPREAVLEAGLALAGFVDDRLKELYLRQQQLQEALDEANAEVALHRRRLQAGSSAVRRERARLTRTAVVTLSAPGGSGEVELALEYLVPGATWAPMYDLRLDRAMEKGALVMRASVAQRTGEDWSGVKLSLSTAKLDRRIEVPELTSLRIGKSQPPAPRSGWREPPPGLLQLFVGYDLAMAKRPPPSGMAQPAPAAEPVSRGAAKVMADIAEEMEVLESLGADPSMDEPMMEDASAPMEALAEEYEAAPPPPVMAPAPRASAMAPGGGAYPATGSRMPPAPPSIPPLAAPKSAPMAKRARSVTRELTAQPELARRQNRLAEPPPPAEVELGSGLLDYGRLFMAGPEEGMARGKLRPANQGEAWELEVYSRVSIRLEVETLVALRRREASAVAHLPRPTHARDVRSAAGSYDYRFDAERRVDVAGDGVWHTVPVATAEVLISPEYVCVPSVDPKVYRTVNVRNVSRHALLAGPMDVTLGDEFLMTVPMPTLAPGGEERVGLGVEEGVKVSRNTRFNEAQGGLFGGAAVLEHGVEIEVANRLAQAIHVEVQERVPVSSEKDIKIEETQVQPAWTPNNKPLNGVLVEGARAWRVKLGANEAKKLSAQYAIRIPNQKVLVGGNRRV